MPFQATPVKRSSRLSMIGRRSRTSSVADDDDDDRADAAIAVDNGTRQAEVVITADDVDRLKVTELRVELGRRGLDTKGTKPVLQTRLREHIADSKLTAQLPVSDDEASQSAPTNGDDGASQSAPTNDGASQSAPTNGDDTASQSATVDESSRSALPNDGASQSAPAVSRGPIGGAGQSAGENSSAEEEAAAAPAMEASRPRLPTRKRAKSKPASAEAAADPLESKVEDLGSLAAFKPATGSWECAGCMCRNAAEKIQCPACLTAKPGREDEVKAAAKEKAAAKPPPRMSFGAAGGFRFGGPAAPPPAATSTGGFTFGSPAAPATPVSAAKATQQQPPPKPAFSFGGTQPPPAADKEAEAAAAQAESVREESTRESEETDAEPMEVVGADEAEREATRAVEDRRGADLSVEELRADQWKRTSAADTRDDGPPHVHTATELACAATSDSPPPALNKAASGVTSATATGQSTPTSGPHPAAARRPIAAAGKKTSAGENAAKAAAVPKGKPKSGRFWKCERDRFKSMVQSKGLKSSFEKKDRLRQELKRVKAYELALKESVKQEKEEMRLKREENKKRREENERKAEIFHEIRNPAKLKRMKKKQMRFVAKRDTTKVEKDPPTPTTTA